MLLCLHRLSCEMMLALRAKASGSIPPASGRAKGSTLSDQVAVVCISSRPTPAKNKNTGLLVRVGQMIKLSEIVVKQHLVQTGDSTWQAIP